MKPERPGPDRDFRIFCWFLVFLLALVVTALQSHP